MNNEKQLSEQESLELITSMINKARNAYNDTGTASLMWGAVIAICSLVMFSQLQWGFRLPFNIYWLTLLALVPQVMITLREKKNRRARTYDELALDFIWLGFGITIFLLVNVNAGVFRDLAIARDSYYDLGGRQFPFFYNEYISSLFLILYGLPTFITGGMCRFRPMLIGGIFCWVCSIICVYTPVKVDLLLTAASAIIAWFIPGILLKRDYLKAKRLERTDV